MGTGEKCNAKKWIAHSEGEVGLRKNNKEVRRSFSTGFQNYLAELDPWFSHLEDFRDALAHRIPLYIPPCTIPTDKEAAYRQLEDRRAEIMKRMSFAERKCLFEGLNRLRAEEKALATFVPLITHSIGERSPQVWLHPQLLSDFFTIEEIAERMLKELDC
jgi:hypothetical protein